jgi:hypothetical protein
VHCILFHRAPRILSCVSLPIAMNPMEQSTCSNLTKYGRIALLTNLCAEGNEIGRDKSQVLSSACTWIAHPCSKGSDDGFARCRVERFGVNDGSGFSLLIGHLRSACYLAPPQLTTINRSSSLAVPPTQLGSTRRCVELLTFRSHHVPTRQTVRPLYETRRSA